MDDLLSVMEPYPSYLLPDYRKKRNYISAMMSKNEIGSTDKYTKKLFLRRQTGYYVINPNLEILIGDEWINVYNIMQTQKLYKVPQPPVILKDIVKFIGDERYDMPIAWLKQKGILGFAQLTCDVDGEVLNNDIELRKIEYLTSTGKAAKTIGAVRCKMPENIGGGQILVDISGVDWQNQYKDRKMLRIRLDFTFGNYAYAYIVE